MTTLRPSAMEFARVFFELATDDYAPLHEVGDTWRHKGDVTETEYSILTASVQGSSGVWHYFCPWETLWVVG